MVNLTEKQDCKIPPPSSLSSILGLLHSFAALYAEVGVSHHKQWQTADDMDTMSVCMSEALVMMVSWLMSSSIPVDGTEE